MQERNHCVTVTTQNQPDIRYLLDKYRIIYTIIGEKKDSLLLKGLNQIIFNYKIYKIAKQNDIDVAIGGSVAISQGVRFLRTQSILFTDDDAKAVPLFAKIAYPFADYVVNPDCLTHECNGRKKVMVPAFKELAYLHPDVFRPESAVLGELGLKTSERFFILRFSGLKAHHDIFAKGIPQKAKLIRILQGYGKVFISSEREPDNEFKEYQINIPPEKIHSVLFYASMLIGDSQTMAAEAAVLGTPSIRCSSFVGRLTYLEELEHKYGLTYGFRPENENQMYKKVFELLNKSSLREEWQQKRRKLLGDKINLTEWMIKFVEAKYESRREILTK